MIKCEAIEDFNLKDFDKLQNIKRNSPKNIRGKLYKGDKFECDTHMVKYLSGQNDEGKKVIKVIEVEACKKKK